MCMKQENMIVETANEFGSLLNTHKYQEASEFLAEDFQLKSLKFNFRTKEDWLNGFPKVHKDIPDFGMFVKEEENANKVQRTGKKKIAFLTINVKEVLEFNPERERSKTSPCAKTRYRYISTEN
jgi:hypothetical protein